MSKRSFHAAFDENTVHPFSNSESGIEKFLDDLARHENSSTDAISRSKTGASMLLTLLKLTMWSRHRACAE